MRRIRGRKLKKQKSLVILILTVLFIFLTTGYAAFSTTIKLNAKGNIKSCSIGRTWEYQFTGSEQEFKAPCDANYKIELWGASNGTNKSSYVSGKIDINKGTKLYVYLATSTSQSLFNYGEVQSYAFAATGSSDIRLINGQWDNFESLKSRIMVAGGAGGRGGLNSWNTGDTTSGPSGGLVGYSTDSITANGISHDGGVGATQTTGSGFGKVVRTKIESDKLFNNSGNGYYSGMTGWYKNGVAGGAGGSSFISGHNGCVAISEDSVEDNIILRTGTNDSQCNDGTTDITCSYHYSNFIFTDTKMIDGKGYDWTTQKGEITQMPKFEGGYYTTGTGYTGPGKAKITLESKR